MPSLIYIESSALVAALLEVDAAAKSSIRAATKRITSASRSLNRLARLSGHASPDD